MKNDVKVTVRLSKKSARARQRAEANMKKGISGFATEKAYFEHQVRTKVLKPVEDKMRMALQGKAPFVSHDMQLHAEPGHPMIATIGSIGLFGNDFWSSDGESFGFALGPVTGDPYWRKVIVAHDVGRTIYATGGKKLAIPLTEENVTAEHEWQTRRIRRQFKKIIESRRHHRRWPVREVLEYMAPREGATYGNESTLGIIQPSGRYRRVPLFARKNSVKLREKKLIRGRYPELRKRFNTLFSKDRYVKDIFKKVVIESLGDL